MTLRLFGPSELILCFASGTDFASLVWPSRVDVLLRFGAVFNLAADFGSAAVRRRSRVDATSLFGSAFLS